MVKTATVGIGVIGAGVISDIYLTNCTSMFNNLRVAGIADLMMDRARSQAEKHGVEAFSVDELLAHPEVEIVVNLTIPAAHADVAMQAVRASKSVYNEKPLTATRNQGKELLRLAGENGVLVGGAPDTFLGGGMQTARKLLDDGMIGEPVAAIGTLLLSGHERWHPNPDFYYQPGGGPLFDMGPYYLAALLSLMGPVSRVSGIASTSYPTRTIGSGPRQGESIPVDTPTHIQASLEFESGITSSLITSFDVLETEKSRLVLYGSQATLRLPDPNTFGGPVELLRRDAQAWEQVALMYGNTENSRGLGLSDMARSLRNGTPHRASGELAYHIVDVMHAVLESSEQGRHIPIESTFERPSLFASS